MFTVETIAGGMMPTNCFLLTDSDTGHCAVIDPGFWDSRLEMALEGKHIAAILLTHGHFDHILGAAAVQKKTGAPVWMLRQEEAFLTDPQLNLSGMMGLSIAPFSAARLLEDGEEIAVGAGRLQVLHTPGHTAGSCCYLGEEVLFTGDTLMAGSAGRTDFPTGNWGELSRSLHRLAEIPGDRKVYSGHGPSTTLQKERMGNPYMRDSGYDFMD